ncbi:TPA: hypothetical protein ACIVON_005067, partial [Salmonella enterica subsp. enterica serovar Poona]
IFGWLHTMTRENNQPKTAVAVTIFAHAHSWIHRNAEKLLFAGSVLQPLPARMELSLLLIR